MGTIYDLASVALFVGLAILYLQRAAAEEVDETPLWAYAIAAVGCALADYLGNNGWVYLSIILFVAVIAFSMVVLKPFGWPPRFR